jgi:two-component system, NarL family, nitrate/nitrite response regulator NarL
VKVISVALVDDQPIMMEGLAYVFGSVPDYHVVAQGHSSDDALAIAEHHQPQIMIIDLAAPRDSLDTISTIARRHPNTRVISFTATPGVEYALSALEAGAKGYVSKSCTVNELVSAIEAVLAGETYVSQNFAARVIAALRNASVRKVAAEAMKLSVREDQIVKLLLQGRTNREIATQLAISEKTVKHYMTVLMQKLNARNRVEVVLAAHQLKRNADAASHGVYTAATAN